MPMRQDNQSTLHETVNVVSSIYTDPNDILELNLKQIVTLLWELIKHYQVTKANQEGELLLVNWIDATLPDKVSRTSQDDWKRVVVTTSVTGLNLEYEKFRVSVPHLFKLHFNQKHVCS